MRLASLIRFPLLALFSTKTTDTSDHNMTKIAVLGGGNVGTTLARALADNGKEVVIAARDPDKTLAKLAESNFTDLNVEPMAKALKTSDVVILATPSMFVGKTRMVCTLNSYVFIFSELKSCPKDGLL